MFDLSGRRSAAVAAATRSEDVALWQLEARRLDLAVETARRYVDVAVAQRRITLTADALALATRTLDVVGERVRAGKVPGTDETKARIAATNSRIEHERAEASFDLARQRLASLWGAPPNSITGVTGSIDLIPSTRDAAVVFDRIASHPSLMLRSVELARRRAVLELERAAGGSDLTVGGGVRYYGGSNDVGLVAGISLPLPFSNVNRGNIAEAEARLRQAEAERSADSVRLTALARELYLRVEAARDEATVVRELLLPDAIAAFEAVREGYTIGRFGLIDVLDAQRTLAATNAQHATALETLHRALAELDALTTLSLTVQESIKTKP